MNSSLADLVQLLLDIVSPSIDRELSVREAAFLRGISESAMRKRINLVVAWRDAFFLTGTSGELRTTVRRMRIAEDRLKSSQQFASLALKK